MNHSTLNAVCCYAGDASQVVRALPYYRHHETDLLILSPENSKVCIPGTDYKHAGRAAYIGADSLTRQLEYFRILLDSPHGYFLIHDSDSFLLSPEIPRELYDAADGGVIWSNEVTEPRPHASPYPKLAFQPSYFLTRTSIEKMLEAAPRVPVHPITPFVDYAMNAWSAEAGLLHRPFTDLEHAPWTTQEPPPVSHPWAQLAYRITFCGTTFMHPIKTADQLNLCVLSYANRAKEAP